jgi:four helix bundle protein
MFQGPIVLARFKDDAHERIAAGAALRGLTAASGPRAALRSMGGGAHPLRARGAGLHRRLPCGEFTMSCSMRSPRCARWFGPSNDTIGNLASQLRRAASSVVLNVAEGSGSFGGVRTQRYRTALGSARETVACLLVAERFGYVEAMPAGLVAGMNHVIGTLVRVAV